MITIKQLEKKDHTNFTALFKQTIADLFPEYGQSVKSFIILDNHIQELFENYSLGAFNGKTIVGYLTTEKPYGGVWYISWLAVSDTYQQKGVGSLLLYTFEKEAIKKGIHNIQLNCDERNLSFYKKLGFEVLGFDKKGYFGVDTYLMKKLIQEPQEDKFLTE